MQGDLSAIILAICYLLVVAGLSLYGLHRYSIIYLYLKHRKEVPRPAGRFKELPRVTIQLPVYNELYVIERLLEAVARLEYPQELLDIQVLDDSTDETADLARAGVERLKAQGFDARWLHRADRTGFKAGALEHGLASAKGEYILILDADFIPGPRLLHETVHFFTNPKIGMVQSRWGHLNADYSLLTRIQAMFLDGHLILEQTARCRSGRFFTFNGTAGLWRRSCIEEAGGWQHDTLTEDMDLSYRAQLAGWRFVFLKDLVTPAELPVDMNGFRSQQHRWTKGSIQTCRKLLGTIWRSPQPWWVKLEASAHLTANFAYLLLLLLCILLHQAAGISGLFGTGVGRLLLFDLPVFLLASVSTALFYLVARYEAAPRTWWREVAYLPLLLALGIGMSINNARAVLEALFNHQSEFTRTPKYGIEHRRQKWSAARYSPLKSLLPLVETGFALYFTWLVIDAVRAGNWFSLPFLLLFQAGFGYVAWSSLSRWMPGGDNAASNPAEVVPA